MNHCYVCHEDDCEGHPRGSTSREHSENCHQEKPTNEIAVWGNSRGEIEKILWKHYDPDSSMNAEEILDEIMPLINKLFTHQRESIVEKLEGKMLSWKHPLDVNIGWKTTYNKALTEAIEVVRNEQKA